MFCAQCGHENDHSARFCPSCGNRLSQTPPPLRAGIVRPRTPRVIAGVCLGIALHFGWDVALTRIGVLVLFVVSGGTALLLYAAAWLLIPQSPYPLAARGDGGSTV